MGREWNDKLARRLCSSITFAENAGAILVTDLDDSDKALVEILSEDDKRVVSQFLIVKNRTGRTRGKRYRDAVTLRTISTRSSKG